MRIARLVSISFSFLFAMALHAQTNVTNDILKEKIASLQSLIKKAEGKKINTLKERTALRTAEIFITYANWDEKHIEENTKYFSKVSLYKKSARQKAEELAGFERNEIMKMLDASISDISSVMKGEIFRLDSPEVDWRKTSVDKDEIVFKGKPVFLADWTWKPTSKYYTEYFGNKDGFLINPNMVNKDGSVTPKVINELNSKDDGSMGFVFINHGTVPKWASDQDQSILQGPGIKYTAYDINNPLSRKIQSNLLKATIPLMAGKKYTNLGYMLCNEPHWNCIKDTYASGPLSDRAISDFKQWLKKKHKDIATLNKLWGSSFLDFETINVPNMMEEQMQGSAMFYDFISYNMYRVNDWFDFLKGEIKKYDPNAKTHIKIMPRYWSDNARDSGIDLEYLSRNSEILGNDASGAGKKMGHSSESWEKKYSFYWREVATSYDFMKSVSPEKIIFNTEGHILTTNRYRNLYEKPEYARSNYWLATIHGMSAIQSWYWCRREDGSNREKDLSPGYAGSNNHQPRIVNEVHATMIDLNSVSDKIMQFQRQRKPIRLFYSKTASINQKGYMDSLFDVYESLYFDGIPLGYATEGIINGNKHDWDVILVANTKSVTDSEVKALQKYIDEGGTIIVDANSLTQDEYGNQLHLKLNESKGKIINVDSSASMKSETMKILEINDHVSPIIVNETNNIGAKVCTWRVIPGDKKNSYIIDVINLGKEKSMIELSLKDNSRRIKSVKSLLTGQPYDTTIVLPVQQVLILEVEY